ncbi:hypothetical protein M8C21_030077, partial [Ambrosia artemisiifolia]
DPTRHNPLKRIYFSLPNYIRLPFYLYTINLYTSKFIAEKMPQRVPTWDMTDVNPNHHIFKPDYEVAELTWEKGQVALHELGSQRVPTKPQPTTEWVQPRATETLEALVNQATLQPPYNKTTNAPVKDVVDDLVPWMHHHNPTVAVNNTNEYATVTSDALVPNKTDAGCS